MTRGNRPRLGSLGRDMRFLTCSRASLKRRGSMINRRIQNPIIVALEVTKLPFRTYLNTRNDFCPR